MKILKSPIPSFAMLTPRQAVGYKKWNSDFISVQKA